jgi:hypothetical protein
MVNSDHELGEIPTGTWTLDMWGRWRRVVDVSLPPVSDRGGGAGETQFLIEGAGPERPPSIITHRRA